MAEWKTKSRIKKTQMVRITGNSEIDIQQLFIGTGVEKAQVFTLNDGIILGSTSCDYDTGWSYEGVKAKITSKVKTWSTTPALFFADIENKREHPLYADGKFTTITIPSGYSLYTIEVAGKGIFTVYENEEPVTFQMADNETITPAKVYRICYKQKAETVNIRVSGVNISWAYMSSCYYFERTERNVKNTVVVTEGIYGNSNMGNGLTIPATPGEKPGPSIYPVIGKLGMNGNIFNFYSMTKVTDNTNVENIEDFDLSLMQGLTHLSYPYVTALKGPIFMNGRGIKYIQLGSNKNPVIWSEGSGWVTDPTLYIDEDNYNTVILTIYTEGGLAFPIKKYPSTANIVLNFEEA
ncbi:hypothetical protein [Fusobacterium sp.]|uniref:hypothetical protein n=1 Tax=Fusobacterium sp. TaxID=68766 RepID=UPI002900E855|nr:hypothetical protein [Fusobacterium sp.]MDU1912263.1 hypothetical protein [Fusobacterium sp.]